MPNKKPDEKNEDKLIFKTEQYITALFVLLQFKDAIIIEAKTFKKYPNCKDKILVEYNKDKDAYKLRLKPVKRKRGIIKPNRRIIAGLS